MSIITMTEAMAAQVTMMSWGQQRFDITSRSVFGAQSIESGAPLWTAEFQVKPLREVDTGVWKSTMLKLAGQTNQFELWDIRRPAPLGTMRGGMVLSVAAEQGDTSIIISSNSLQGGRTLLEGDMLQLGSGETQQVIILTDGAFSDSTGDIEVFFQGPLRNDFAQGATVIWDKPKALFRRTSADTQWNYEPLFARGFAMTLIEDWRA